MNFDLYFTPYKNTSEWIMYLKIKPKTIKLPEENRKNNFYSLWLGKDLLAIIPKRKEKKR